MTTNARASPSSQESPDPLTPPPDFAARVEELGVQLDPGDLDKFGSFLALLLHTNKTHNLTAVTDPREAWTRHIFDALTLMPLLVSLAAGPEVAEQAAPPSDLPQAPPPSPAPRLRVIDVGSGGGVPGIPLAIAMPEARFTLLEATGKKADFLRAAASALALSNITVVHGRAEQLGQDHREHREKYDAAVIRAVGHLAVAAELTVPFVRPGGIVLAVKGAKAEEEIAAAGKAIGQLGARHAETVATPTGRIVVLEKVSRTPRLYPRRDGEPKRVPLGIRPTH